MGSVNMLSGERAKLAFTGSYVNSPIEGSRVSVKVWPA